MRLLCAISTKMAIKFAIKLFYQPIPFNIPEREKPMQNESEVFDLKTTSGKDFTAYKMGNGTKRIVMIHGWSGRGTQFFKIADKLKSDFEIIAIDAPAHGKHKGPKTNMLEFIDAVRVCESNFGHFDYAIGHSLGGQALFGCLLMGSHFDKLVNIGAPSSIPNVVSDFCQTVRANKKVAQGILKNIKDRFDYDPEEISSLQLAKNYNPKGLIVHDEDDKDVSVEAAKELHKVWLNSQLMITTGLGHRRVLLDKLVVEKIYDFFKN